MTILEIKLSISDVVLRRLQAESERRKVSIDTIISESLEESFDEPTDIEILAMMRESMLDALAGNVRPAHEVLDEIESESLGDGDNS